MNRPPLIDICEVWHNLIQEEKNKPYFVALRKFIEEERKTKNIYPAKEEIWECFYQTPYHKLKVVILGQDPYHQPATAHGLAFSSLQAQRPYSLDNIFREIYNDYWLQRPKFDHVFEHNCLIQWANQGVLLLNTVLTVEQGKAGSHKNKGWENLTISVIEKINRHEKNIVFMLWGAAAKKYSEYIDSRHLVLESEHPAAVAHNSNAWFGNKHFTKANDFINKQYMPGNSINWGIFMKNIYK